MHVSSSPNRQTGTFCGPISGSGNDVANWTVAFIRRPYQAALRRGLPDALDLMVVCAEAGLGLGSTVERVAQEMQKSNRPSPSILVVYPRAAHHARPQDSARQSS